MKKDYQAPAIHELGSLAELTSQCFNKIGQSADSLSAQNPNVIGSMVPVPCGA